MKKTFNWDNETKTFTCSYHYKGKHIVGTAHCHPSDLDFCSERTGGFIAELRADIICLKYIKATELRPRYEALTRLKKCFESKKDYQANSYEYKVLCRELQMAKNDLDTTSQELVDLQQTLKTYLAEKDKLYNKFRKGQKQTN